MSRYLVFAGDTYYPAGGWDDFVGAANDIEHAREIGRAAKTDWWQIVDTQTMQEVKS